MPERALPDSAAPPRPPSLASDGSSPTWLADSAHTWGGPSVLLTAGWAGEVIDIARLRADLPQVRDGREVAARFEQLVLLGKGGMGEVWRVRDVDLNRVVAMKIVRMGSGPAEPLFARFVAEAQATAQLEHPGIVPVYELGRLPDGRVYYTMQEIRGRNLAAVLTDLHAGSTPEAFGAPEGGLGFLKVVEAYRQVCDTIAYAHARGVIHRDLKPANIMLGAFGEVRVVDWGLVKVLDQAGGAADREIFSPLSLSSGDSSGPATSAGAVAGTRGYMPPEQARGEIDRLGPTADVYALGGILFALLAGRAPADDDPAAALRALPRVPGPLIEVVARAMAPDPAARFADAGQLAAAIRQWLERATEAEQDRERIDRVERAFESLPEPVQAEARHALLAMHGRDGRPVARPVGKLDASTLDILSQLGIIQVKDNLVSLCDPDLLARWERLNAWLDAERDTLPLRQGLHDQAEAWAAHGRRRDHLWHGEQLEEAERWIRQREPRLHACERDFVAESRLNQDRLLRRRKLGTIGVIGALSAGLLFMVGLERRTSDALDAAEAARVEQKKAMDQANARALGAEGALAAYSNEPHRALALALGSLAILPDPHVTQRLAMRAAGLSAMHALAGHRGFVYHVEWLGPDRVASAGIDRTLRIWDTTTGVQLQSFSTAAPPVTIGPSPDGQRLAAILENGDLELWDTRTGARISTTRAHPSFGLWAEFDPTGTRIVSTATNSAARVWDGLTGAALYTVNAGTLAGPAATFSKTGGRLLVSGGAEPTVVDAASGEVLFRPPLGHHADRAALSADGQRIALLSPSGELSVWRVDGGARLWTTESKPWSLAPQVAFNPVSDTLYVAYQRGALTALRASDGELLRSTQPQQGSLRQLDVSASGAWLLTVNSGTVTLWDGETLEPLDTYRDPGGLVPVARMSRSGDAVAIASEEGVVRLWSPRVAHSRPLDRCGGEHADLRVDSANGAWLAMSTPSGLCVRPIDADTPKPGVLHLEDSPLAISRDGGALLVQRPNRGDLALLDTATGQPRWSRALPHGVTAGALSLHERAVVVQGEDRIVLTLNAETGEPLEHGPQLDMTFMSGSLQELAAQPVVPYMLPDASVVLLDGETGVELRHLPAGMAGSAGSFTGHSFPDGARFAVGDSQGTVRVLDPRSDAEPAALKVGDASILSVSVAPGGALVAAVDSEGELNLIDPAGPKLLRTISTGDSTVERLKFSPDGAHIVTMSSESAMTVWDTQTGQPVWRWENPERVLNSGCVLESGELLQWTEGTLRLWDIDAPKPGTLTNLRTCPGTVDTVPVQPYPSPDEVWAPPEACAPASQPGPS